MSKILHQTRTRLALNLQVQILILEMYMYDSYNSSLGVLHQFFLSSIASSNLCHLPVTILLMSFCEYCILEGNARLIHVF